MANTILGTDHALAVKLWEAKTYMEALQESAFGTLFGSGAVTLPTEFKTRGFTGDEITVAHVNQLTGGPIMEGETARGNEEAIDKGYFTMRLGYNRKPIEVPGNDTMDQQRTKVLFQDVGREALTDYCVQLLDFSTFNQLAGYTATSFTGGGYTYSGNKLRAVLGHNTALAPSVGRQLWAGTSNVKDEDLSSGDTLELRHIDMALEKIDSNRHPIKMLGNVRYQLWISPEQAFDLKHSTDTRTWYDIQRAKAEGGKSWNVEALTKKSGAWFLGEYSNVEIYVHSRIAYGVNSSTSAPITTVRRAVLVGKNALFYGTPWNSGNPQSTGKGVPVKYSEEVLDYTELLGICGKMMYGLKKPQPSNAPDLGTFVISTYAAPHA
ncbi:MAG: DUF4043 family protein [Alphaproteobacteria bacterium]|jgi:hypothetical protein|nr:DUF4043 family protein [Alphaproteobacteria bacterium]